MSPLSRNVARRNKRHLNKVMRHLASWAPGLGLLTHTGRRWGAQYTIPINVFVRDGRYLIALTYGSEADWVRNVLASGEAELVTRRRRYRLTDPVSARDESLAWAPPPVRLILRRIKAFETLTMRGEPVR